MAAVSFSFPTIDAQSSLIYEISDPNKNKMHSPSQYPPQCNSNGWDVVEKCTNNQNKYNSQEITHGIARLDTATIICHCYIGRKATTICVYLVQKNKRIKYQSTVGKKTTDCIFCYLRTSERVCGKTGVSPGAKQDYKIHLNFLQLQTPFRPSDNA